MKEGGNAFVYAVTCFTAYGFVFTIVIMDDSSLSHSSSCSVMSTAWSTTEQKEKGKWAEGKCRAGVLCAFLMVFLNERDYNLAKPHLAVIKRDLYMYIFAWLQKKSRACDKHSSTLLSLSVSVCLQVRRSHLELWVLLQKIAGFHRQGSKFGPFPAGSCFSTLKYIKRYNFYKRAWIIRTPSFTLHSFAFLPGPLYPLRLGWMRNQHLYKTPFCAWPKTPTPNNPSLASSLKLGIHRRFLWDAALSVRTTGLGKSIRPRWMDSIEAFRHSKIQTSPGSFLTCSQHNWVCSQSARTKPAVAHTKLSLPQCCSPWLSLFVVSLEVLCQH